MNRTDLLIELEMLPHSARMKRAVELGREPQNVALWNELEGGNSYEKRLALQSCHGSRDGARVLRLSSDASRLVRNGAISVAAAVCDEAQLATLFAALSARPRRLLLVALLKLGRSADAMVSHVARQGGDVEALLGLASPQLAANLLASSWGRASLDDWARLARSQPKLALAQVLAEAVTLEVPDRALLARANAVLGSASEREPDLALGLARELSRVFPLAELDWSGLLRMRAQATAEMVLDSGDRLALDWGGVAHRLSRPTLLALAERLDGALRPLHRVLKRLPIDDRAALYARFGRGWRDERGAIEPQVLALLPRSIRVEEARRHLALPALGAQPAMWLPYISFLPWDEALERARPLLGDPDPSMRASAHTALAQAVRFERARADEWLALVQSRGNEQDPVRMAMLSGLSTLPSAIWSEEHLPALRIIQRQALDARDLSYVTAAHLQRFVVLMLPRFPEWCGEQISELLKERGNFAFYSVEDRVNEAQMRELGPRLEPIFAAWARREHTPFLSAIQAFGKRLKVWDGGARLLVEATQNGSTAQNSGAATILAKHRKDIWRGLVPTLLQRDESWGLLPIVYNFVHRERQDLLSMAMLGRAKPRGRFWSGQTRFVLPLSSGFWRWTPEQQGLYQLTLAEVLGDTSRDSPGAFFAIDRLAALPDVEPAALLWLASMETKTLAWREGALRVLSRLDAGQGVPTLLEALDDERARIAIYGLRRALLEMPAPKALEIVRGVPLARVTVAKEVVRLLGDIKEPSALDALLEFAPRELHRDVRVALLRALWEHLEDPRAWPILESAASSEDAAIAIMAARTTAPRLSTEARRKLNDLLARLLAHPDVRVRLQVLANAAVGALSDPEKRLLAPMFACLESRFPEEYQAAAQAVWRTYAAREAELAGAAIERLLPHRRALSQVVNLFVQQQIASRRHFTPTARAILEALRRDPLALSLRLQLAMEVLEPQALAEEVERLQATGELHADAISTIAESLERGPSRWNAAQAARTMEWLEGLRALWVGSQVPTLRRLSLSALKGMAASSSGWTDERIEQLEALRRDESVLVASAAQWTFLPGE